MLKGDIIDQERGQGSRTAHVIFLLAFVVATVLALTADIRQIVSTVHDDSGYYLEIAENIVNGKGATFDGLHATNGYQPLWLYLLTLLHLVYRGSPETMLRICIVLQAALMSAAGILVYRIQSRAFATMTATIGAVAFVVLLYHSSLNGMETALLIFMTAVLLLTGHSAIRPHMNRICFLLGIVLGLTVLARLDAVFIGISVAVFLAVDLLRGRTKADWKPVRFLLVGAGSALVLLPYLGHNLVTTGTIIPISGALKSTFPGICTTGYGFSRLGTRNLVKAAAAIVYLAWYLLPNRRRSTGAREYYRSAVAVLSAGVLLHLVHTVLFMKWAVFSWHFATYGLLGVLVICEPIEFVLSRIPGRFVKAAWPVILSATLIAGAWIIRGRILCPPQWTVQSYEAAIWSRKNTGPDDVMAMKDAGIFGYFCRRRVVNLDGVAGDMRLQEVLRDGKLKEYLEECGVTYIVQHAVWHRRDVLSGEYTAYTQEYPSRGFDGTGDSLTLPREDEVYRSPVYFDGPFETVFLIWRFRP